MENLWRLTIDWNAVVCYMKFGLFRVLRVWSAFSEERRLDF